MADLSRSYEEMVLISRRRGSPYFKDDTIRFWNSKVHDAPNKYGLFIESIDNARRSGKMYCVKFFSPDGYITTVEPAMQAKTDEHFTSYEDAKKFRHNMTIALNQAAKCYREGKVLELLYRIEEVTFNSGIYTLTNEEGESITVNTNNFDRFVCG